MGAHTVIVFDENRWISMTRPDNINPRKSDWIKNSGKTGHPVPVSYTVDIYMISQIFLALLRINKFYTQRKSEGRLKELV